LKWVGALLLALALGGDAAAQGTGHALTLELGVRRFELANGLEVLYAPRHGAPVASVQVIYHVGSKDDPSGKRGMAHLFEHLLARGSKHVRPGMHEHMIEALGGRSQASASEDLTILSDDLPSGELGFALRLEADRMRGLALQPAAIASDRELVKAERRRRIDDDPGARAFTLMRHAAFRVHPYRYTAMGEPAEVDSITPADCRAFYDRFYQPGNATVVVVGDVDEDEVRREVEAAFGAIPAAPAAARNATAEPPQTEYVEKVLTLAARVPLVVGGFKIPAAAADDGAALEVLARLLSSGEAGLLPAALVRGARVAVGAGAVAFRFEQPGLFVVYAAHPAAVPGSAVKQALLDTLARLHQPGALPEAEVARARGQVLTEHLRALESPGGLAGELGRSRYLAGGWQRLAGELARIQKVGPADLMQVAQRYLKTDNLTLVMLVPAPAATRGQP
jgi:zinc protease